MCNRPKESTLFATWTVQAVKNSQSQLQIETPCKPFCVFTHCSEPSFCLSVISVLWCHRVLAGPYRIRFPGFLRVLSVEDRGRMVSSVDSDDSVEEVKPTVSFKTPAPCQLDMESYEI